MNSLLQTAPWRLALVVAPLLMIPHPVAWAQDGSMKACGEKWQAAKAANATNGATWTKFLAECRAAGVAAAPQAASVAALPAATPPPAAETKAGAKPRAEPVFPRAVAAKFADLRPGPARQKTCSEQYQANKASDGNGGLRWLEKGGGYWSLCNRKLKGV